MEIAESIYARMRAEQQRIADRERAEGTRRGLEIRADVDRRVAIILADAERDANNIRFEGQAAAIDIFAKVLVEEPGLSRYQKSPEAYLLSEVWVQN